MFIQDETGHFSSEDLQELRRFVQHDLLSTDIELDWLGKIIIRNDGRSGYGGYWDIKIITNSDDSDAVEAVIAIIVLNYYIVQYLPLLIRLDRLKEILAHEYGHHWTLSYLIVNGIIQDYFQDRLPKHYYQIRGLNLTDHAPDYSKDWCNCDKEIIAEDYRCSFAPSSYNKNHQMKDHLPLPSIEVQRYINNLNNLSLPPNDDIEKDNQ